MSKPINPGLLGGKLIWPAKPNAKGVVVRFRFNETGVRMAHPGDPVMDKRGKVIGTVTSCAADKEGYLLGQAYLDLKFADEGTPIFIFQGAPKKANKAPAELSTGRSGHDAHRGDCLTPLPKISIITDRHLY